MIGSVKKRLTNDSETKMLLPFDRPTIIKIGWADRDNRPSDDRKGTVNENDRPTTIKKGSLASDRPTTVIGIAKNDLPKIARTRIVKIDRPTNGINRL